ncbi:BolA/IbaG family iron-sulfur metabolism protein [[Haemophilus] ducreyi]|uniref:BolA/IbaG family iron-sulfur metabolism protein n=1 Tax=Haemophilus ducreyi TaxID=730 RepID=UPI0006561E52|nr:BolA/IbaG family iron-sulfur metabolism protein [[Haemophilus] ducreyi]AKO45874.1 BolA [[Haemophilus] ducreyi]AKO47233.1 BolA [[Haemophilus] ducreyi]AKO48597.1 BolA [[Haemophilus] ducreyi]AKO49967.1 BolA [[Haemophilus] ducreyi]ANF62322.1 transcriptional regulator [[Haemophilus] ducreyi]
MLIEQIIRAKLDATFSPVVLKIENESYMHSSGKGAESHFKVVLVSDLFIAQRAVARHQAVYNCLADELANGVHALALHTYTSAEWIERQGIVAASPNCVGVGQ